MDFAFLPDKLTAPVVFEGRTYARALGSDILRTYTICGVWTIGLWFLYPIAWVGPIVLSQ